MGNPGEAMIGDAKVLPKSPARSGLELPARNTGPCEPLIGPVPGGKAPPGIIGKLAGPPGKVTDACSPNPGCVSKSVKLVVAPDWLPNPVVEEVEGITFIGVVKLGVM